MPAELINTKTNETMKSAADKLNKSIQDAFEAYIKSRRADENSNQALNKARKTEEQLKQVVIEGDSSVEAAQARVNAYGGSVATLTERIEYLEMRINVKMPPFNATGGGVEDDTQAIQKALDYVRDNNLIAEVYIPNGIYKVTKELYIHANTYLRLEDTSVILRAHNGNLLRNYQITDDFSGYNGNGNVTIEGGIFDCNGMEYPATCNGIAWAHAQGITMRKVTIKDTVNGHAMELTGVRDVLVDNCKFIGWRDTEVDRRYYFEAIQIELTSKEGYVGLVKDYTETKDVLVQNCYFGNSGTPGFRAFNVGVGSHGALYNKYYSNIKVLNNTFEGATYWAVRALKWRDSVISDNKFNDCPGGGIYIVTPANGGGATKDENGVDHPPQTIGGFTVSENRFMNMGGRGIKVEGQEGAYINDVQLLNNRGHTIEGIGLELSWMGGSLVNSNRFRNVNGRGLSLNNVLYSTISLNKYENIRNNAVFMENSRDVECHSNTFVDVDFYGFNITGTNSDIAIERNRLKNVALAGNYDGIIVGTGASDIRVVGNKVKSTTSNVPRFGLNIQTGVTGVVRYGNDFRCNASTANLGDSSTNPVTTPGDAV